MTNAIDDVAFAILRERVLDPFQPRLKAVVSDAIAEARDLGVDAPEAVATVLGYTIQLLGQLIARATELELLQADFERTWSELAMVGLAQTRACLAVPAGTTRQ